MYKSKIEKIVRDQEKALKNYTMKMTTENLIKSRCNAESKLLNIKEN